VIVTTWGVARGSLPFHVDTFSTVAPHSRSKLIAAKLLLSEVTVKVHRARMMRKLELRSPVEIVRLVDSMPVRYEPVSDWLISTPHPILGACHLGIP
jgi:hypothetical protein